MNLAPYRKAVVAGAGVLTTLGQVLADGTVTAEETGLLATAVAVAIGVFGARNEDTVPEVDPAAP